MMRRLENQDVTLAPRGGGGWAAETVLSWKHSDQGDQHVVAEMSELKSPGGRSPAKITSVLGLEEEEGGPEPWPQ